MESGVGVVGDITVKAEVGDVRMETEPAVFADSHVTNGLTKDSSENEVFEDAIEDAESLKSPQYTESGLVLEGNHGDSSLGQGLENIQRSKNFEDDDQSPEKDNNVSSEVVDSIVRSQVNDVSFGRLETATDKKVIDCPVGEQDDSHVAIPAFNADDRGGDVEELNPDVLPENSSSLCHNLAEPPGKEKVDESENSAQDGEGMVVINSNGDESDGAIGKTPDDDGEIVSLSGNENLGNEKPQNVVIGDEVSFHEVEQSVDGFECEEDISNKHEIEEILNGRIDDVREDDGLKLEADSLLVEERSADSDVTSENEEPLTPSGGPTSQTKSIVKEDMPKESVFVEDVGDDLSSIDDDENDTLTRQVSSSHSHPDPSSTPALPSRPAGLGSSAPLLEPSRSLQPSRVNGSAPHQHSQNSVPDDIEESDEIREKLQMIRVKFLRLAHRLGQTPHNVVVAQVLYRLGLAEQLRRNTNRQGVFSFDQASVMAEQLEAAGKEPLNFTCTILVIGKTGVGKSATINSIFDFAKVRTDAFHLGTKKFQDVLGTVQGIQVRVIDTPGLSSCPSDQRRNEKILNSIKRFINKTPPDIVLYFDRLDMQSRDYGDVPLLRTITDVFGTSIWFNAIVVLTHAASAPPDGPNGSPLSYEMFVTQRSHVVQQAIRQAAGDVRLMNPVSLVENHTACRMNRAGQRVLPNGQVWKPQLLLLSFASKILQEANMLLKLEDSPPGRPFGTRTKVPPLPFLLSSLLQTRHHLKLPEEQMDDEDDVFEGLEETSDGDDGSDYDELPPFKSLTRAQLANLSKAQRKAYHEELDYREKLFIKKQIKEERKRRKLLKKMTESAPDVPVDHSGENVEDESGGPASVPVPMPDMVLPNSFDSDNPAHRYRFLDSSNKWLVRPVLETQGWDHDVGYEGLNVERLFVVRNKIPLSISGQITKDKKDCSLQMEMASSLKHSEGTGSSVGLELQTVGKDMAYTLRGETKFKNFRRNSTTAGLSVTILGDSMSAGAKVEDKLVLSKRLSMLLSGGAMTGRGDVAYGGRLEATLREQNYPIGRALSTIALSVVDWHGDLAVGCNIQTQRALGRGANAIFQGNLSNKGSGQLSIRLSTSDQVRIALVALLPVFRSVVRVLSTSSEAL